jgi:hypothetical protein
MYFPSFGSTIEPVYGVLGVLGRWNMSIIYMLKITTQVDPDNHNCQIIMQWDTIFVLLKFGPTWALVSVEEAMCDHSRLHSSRGLFQTLSSIHYCDFFFHCEGRIGAITNLLRHTIILGCSSVTPNRLGAKLQENNCKSWDRRIPKALKK